MNKPTYNDLISSIQKGIKTIEEQRNRLNVEGRLVYLPNEGEAVILGDLHGDYKSLQTILKHTNLESKLSKNLDQYLICLGDYIDRGSAPIQVIHKLLTILNEYPDQVILLRGNHEGPVEILKRVKESVYHFHTLIEKTYTIKSQSNPCWNLIDELFDNLYTGCVIQNRALLVHGGIPTEATNLRDIAYAHQNHPKTTHLEEILWNDPSTIRGRQMSFRGAGYQYGLDLAEFFLEENGLRVIIRGHECYDEGYYFHGDRILTLHSCKLPVYRNTYLAYLSVPLNIDFTREYLMDYIYQL